MFWSLYNLNLKRIEDSTEVKKMGGFNLRKRARVCYYEPEEPPFDEFVFCTECRDYVYEYCAIHGPLLVIPDDKVPTRTGLPAWVPRAALTIPKVFLHLATSNIPEAGIGVFSTLTLPPGVRFGPYRGRRVQDPGDSCYGWQIYSRAHKPLHVVDARDANDSNWMRYVNCSRHHAEQNLVAFQYRGELYYRTVKLVPRFTELLVFYGSEFAASLAVDLRAYRKPCCDTCQTQLAKKNEQAKSNKRQARVEDKKEKPTDGKIDQAQVAKKKTNKHQTQDEKKSPIENKTDQTEVAKKNEFPKKIKRQKRVGVKNDTPINEDIGRAKLTKTKKSTNKRMRVEEKEKPINDSATKGITVKKLQERSKPSQDDILTDTDIQEVSPEQKAISDASSNSNAVKDGKGFYMKSDLEKHVHTHFISKNGTSKDFTCVTCGSKFDKKLLLLEHAKSQHGVKYFTCNQCEYATIRKGGLQSHFKVHTGEKPFKCSHCSAAFTHRGNLHAHERIHTGEKPFKCSHCSAAFAHCSVLRQHERIHTGEKPFKCSHCSAAFTQIANLQNHERIHTREKPFKCSHCSAAFACKSDLRTHERIHTGEKPYECNICDYKATCSGNLKRHLMSRHSGLKPYGCDTCSYRGATRKHLTQHMKRHQKYA